MLLENKNVSRVASHFGIQSSGFLSIADRRRVEGPGIWGDRHFELLFVDSEIWSAYHSRSFEFQTLLYMLITIKYLDIKLCQFTTPFPLHITSSFLS
jgi:hypothetical protein